MQIKIKAAEMEFFDDEGNPVEQPADLNLGNLTLRLGQRNKDTLVLVHDRPLVGVRALELRYEAGSLPTVRLDLLGGFSGTVSNLPEDAKRLFPSAEIPQEEEA
ncbi:hypothetical protein [Deinococcus sp. S9]|uniref:hypothetical protein n=1 Tax=Deinococcus sp. S9 TaxID=2545754 RepID=UPI0010555741|nr:hypothetical protein [Deinococcus sp. S9]TDE87370.1 hypothetical protein E0686_02435 [Deinococcus sp. S9]